MHNKPMMIKMKSVLLLLLGSILLLSCDPGLINNYVVENRSDHSIEAEFRFVNGYSQSSPEDSIRKVRIEPKSTTEVIDYSEIGTAKDKNQHFLEAFDTLYLRVEGMEVKKDIAERKNWNYKVVRRGPLTLDEVEYILVIENGDLEKID